jgi:hypothetical protein
VVERDAVDRVDRGLRVRVRRQQCPLGVRRDLERRLQQLDAGHAGHALVDQQQRDRGAPELRLAQGGQRLLAAAGPQHAIVASVATAQVALDGARHRRLVVDRQQHRP